MLAAPETRAFDFETRSKGNGRRLEGYAAVFGHTARIDSHQGTFDERMIPGAFTRSLRTRTPVLQFEHGRDPRVGAVPIGAIDDIHEDRNGLFVAADLFDNAVVEPIRQAIASGAIKGMSFRFQVPAGGDTWTRTGATEVREVRDADVHECGPVIFPAYAASTVSVRSLLAGMDPEEYQALIRELAAELRLAPPEDITRRREARSSRGGDDAQPGSGDASVQAAIKKARHTAFLTRGLLK